LNARVTPARSAALDVMRALRDGELADNALERAYSRVPPRDRAWLQELAYGTIRLRGRIDHLLDQLVRRGIDSLRPDLLDLLRLGVYQLLEMRSVPPYAAVSQTVEGAKLAVGTGASRLVNGVLQGLRRRLGRGLQGDDPWEGVRDLFPDREGEPLAYLSTWGSHPRWLVERWVSNFGVEATSALIEANNRRPELYLRPVGRGVAEALTALREVGLEGGPVRGAPDAIKLDEPGRLLEAFETIPAIVQDPAAGLVVRYAAPNRGSVVADLCAAPGGKAIALAEDASYLVAGDISLGRLERLRANLDRIRDLPVGVIVADARVPPVEPLDLVLLDVPCTGTGTLRRHPDGRWRISEADLASLTTLQSEILEGAATRVRPGGLLVYATCSLEPEENVAQVDAFLERHPEFTLEPPPTELLERELLDQEGRLAVYPWVHGFDGAFAARLRRDR